MFKLGCAYQKTYKKNKSRKKKMHIKNHRKLLLKKKIVMEYYQVFDQLYFFLTSLLITVCIYSYCHPNKRAYVKVFRATCFINRHKFYSWSFCCFLYYSNIYHWESLRFSLQLKLVLSDKYKSHASSFPIFF